jgi:hypothetical protein
MLKKRQETYGKKEKKGKFDSELDWTWTTICIYKKQGKKI